MMHADALYELVDYIEEQRGSGLSFPMAELVHLYEQRLEVLGFPDLRVQTTRLSRHRTSHY